MPCMGAEGSASLAPPSSTTGSQRFRRLFQVGKGGMGSVDVALERGDGSFQRIVALKRCLRESAEDARNREMFFREARLAALLQHPNVVHAFNFGEINGEPFLTMEYVEGEALSRLVAAAADRCEGLPIPLAAHILAEMCEGLHAVHELRDVDGTALNVVHRDLSPHNVMVAYTGHVKLLDFGIAKFDTPNEDMTRTGEVKGKVAYMSPEQALGERVDRRSDLYALGAILFELLTSRRMWGSGTELEVMRRLALEDPPSLREALPQAPESLVKLFGELVAKNRNARPLNAADVAARLHEIARATGVGNREGLEQYMLHVFGDRAEERRQTMSHALKSSEIVTPDAATSSVRTTTSDLPTRSEDRLPVANRARQRAGSKSGSNSASQITIPRKRLNLAAAAVALGFAISLTIGIAAFGPRNRPHEQPIQAIEPIVSANVLPTHPATLPSAESAPSEPLVEQPRPSASAKRVYKAPTSPILTTPARASTTSPAPLGSSPPPVASVPLKSGSGLPFISSPLK